MRVALVSFNPVWEHKKDNRLEVEKHLQSIVGNGVEWAIFPEMTLTGFTMNIAGCAEDVAQSPTIHFFSKCAIIYNMYLSFGVILKEGSKATNNLITISPDGELIASYAKIHPFSYAGEDKHYQSGSQIVTATIRGIPVGMTICYDLRFPELFQALSKTCNVIINIACWPTRRILHWNVLMQARAIENQVFFIGVNRTGKDAKGVDYQKSSAVFSPQGIALNMQALDPEVDIVEIDFTQVDTYRQSFPVKNDRKPELYKQIL